MPSHRPYPELRPCHYRYGGPNDPNLSSSDGLTLSATGTAVIMTPTSLVVTVQLQIAWSSWRS